MKKYSDNLPVLPFDFGSPFVDKKRLADRHRQTRFLQNLAPKAVIESLSGLNPTTNDIKFSNIGTLLILARLTQ